MIKCPIPNNSVCLVLLFTWMNSIFPQVSIFNVISFSLVKVARWQKNTYVLKCPYIPSFSPFQFIQTLLLLLYSLSVGVWTNLPSAPAPGTQPAFIPNEGLMNFLKGGDGPNWSWYVPSGREDEAIRWSLVLLPCDSQTRPKWKNLLALTGQFTVY